MPKIVDKDQKRKEIANAAIGILAKKGFENTTISDIAKAANIGKGTVYQYFETKEEIIIQVAMELLGDMDKMFGMEFFQIPDPREKLRVLVAKSSEMIGGMKELMMVYLEIWRINIRDNELGVSMMILQDALVSYRKLIESIIKDGKKQGIFKKEINEESMAVFFTASMDGLGMHYLLNGEGFDLELVCTDFLEGLFKGLEV